LALWRAFLLGKGNMQEGKYISVLTLNNLQEAQLLEGFLTERDIPHLIRTNHDTAYDGIFQLQFGWGEVLTPKEYQDQVKQIYNDINKYTPKENEENLSEN